MNSGPAHLNQLTSYLKKPGLLVLGLALLALGAGLKWHPRSNTNPGSNGGSAGQSVLLPAEYSSSLEGSQLAQQFRQDLVGVLRARVRAESLSAWKRSGFAPEEVFKNARALAVPEVGQELCKAMLSLNGSELAAFEPALDLKENARWVPCLSSVKRRIEKHWDESRIALITPTTLEQSQGLAVPLNLRDPLRQIEFAPSSLITGDEIEPGEVAITFSGGPDANRTTRLLRILKEHGVRATFFLSGEEATAYSAEAMSIRAQGHTIGALTWSNRSLREVDLKSGAREIERGIQAVAASSGGPVAFFRFPFGDHRDLLVEPLNQSRLTSIGWNIDAKDWKTSSPSEALEQTLSELAKKRGGIINLQANLAQAEILLPSLLRALRVQKFVPIVLGK